MQCAAISRVLAISFLASIPLTTSASTFYSVLPIALSNEYAVAGGFIETNGALGSLAPADILDFEFVVTGPLGYTFTSTSPSASWGGTIVATKRLIVVPIDKDPSPRNYTGFGVAAVDDEDSSCMRCSQQLSYASQFVDSPMGQTNQSHIAFYMTDSFDFVPSEFATVEFQPQIALIIAAVPEPSSICLVSITACVSIAVLAPSCKYRFHRSTV